MIERDRELAVATIAQLRSNLGWSALEDRLQRALEGSYAHCSAVEQGRLIGFARVISDGALYALIVDVMVHPEHQPQGLGQRLLMHTIRELERDGIHSVQVIFDASLEPFYRVEVLRAGVLRFSSSERTA